MWLFRLLCSSIPNLAFAHGTQHGTCNVQPPHTRKESRFHPCDILLSTSKLIECSFSSFLRCFAGYWWHLHLQTPSTSPHTQLNRIFASVNNLSNFFASPHWTPRIDYVRSGLWTAGGLTAVDRKDVSHIACTHTFLPHKTKAFDNRFMFRRLPTEAASTSEAVAQKRKLCFASLCSIRSTRI